MTTEKHNKYLQDKKMSKENVVIKSSEHGEIIASTDEVTELTEAFNIKYERTFCALADSLADPVLEVIQKKCPNK